MSKRLTDLNPVWVGRLRPNSGEGIHFDCPACGPTHTLAAYFKNPCDGKPAQECDACAWIQVGESFNDLTITPSIQYPCWHGWVECGRVIDVTEAPLTIVRDGQRVALSPLQAENLAKKQIENAQRILDKVQEILK